MLNEENNIMCQMSDGIHKFSFNAPIKWLVWDYPKELDNFEKLQSNFLPI